MTVTRGIARRSFTRLTIGRMLLAGVSALLLCLGSAAAASAATVTFGSSLSVEATINTAHDLDYKGTVEAKHDGADTALWNVALPSGESPTATGSGEITSVKLEGCAKPEGAEPLTQIHFQDVRSQSGGSYRVEGTSAPFDIPVCDPKKGVSGSTITTYSLEKLCVLEGDYVDFNDEGGFEPTHYPAGVPYEVIGSVQDATMDSFIKDGATGNGAVFSPRETGVTNGFASNPKEELMLQVTIDTAGSYFCTGSEPPPPAEKKSKAPSGEKGGSGGKSTPPPKKVETVKLLKKSTRVNRKGLLKVSVSCKGNTPCSGTLVLKAKTAGKGGMFELGHAKLNLADGSKHTYFVHLSKLGRKRLRVAKHRRVKVAVTVRASSGEPSPVGTLLVRK